MRAVERSALQVGTVPTGGFSQALHNSFKVQPALWLAGQRRSLATVRHGMSLRSLPRESG